jgi:hypothetical protein
VSHKQKAPRGFLLVRLLGKPRTSLVTYFLDLDRADQFLQFFKVIGSKRNGVVDALAVQFGISRPLAARSSSAPTMSPHPNKH